MRKLIPFLDNPVQPATPSTEKRFSAVFAALTLALQTWHAPFGNQLAGHLSMIYNRISTMLYGDPANLKRAIGKSRLFYLNYLRAGVEGAMLNTPSGIPGVQMKMGFLEDVINLRESFKGTLSPSALQFFDAIVFAVLSFDRIMTYPVPANYSTITDPAVEPDPKLEGSVGNIPTLLEQLGITPAAFKKVYTAKCKAQKHIIMSTAGVNGPATWTAHSDAKAIMGNATMYKVFQAFCEESGLSRFTSDLLGTVSLPSWDTHTDQMLQLGRLHTIEEWGGKTRIVAIVDYWTQLVLTPLHETIFEFLGKIEADGTFDQEAMADRVRGWTADPSRTIYSYDLTAATDRLPIKLQERVLEALMGPSFASGWRKLLVDRDYVTPEGTTVRYNCGQPMGAKSSWAMLALTHHVIVQQAANNAGATDYMDYALLGDDNTMCGSTVAANYRKIMSYYSVPINMEKSVVPFAGAASAAEICKRVFIEGVEVSVFPVKLIAKTVMNGRLAAQLQNHITPRMLDIPHGSLLTWLGGLIDQQSLQFLTILNMLPTSVSGLFSPQLPLISREQLGVYYPHKGVDPDDIPEAFTYTAIVEQLKRLDTLLRQTQVITAAIETNAYGYHTQRIANLGWQYVDPGYDIKALAASMPKFNATHPIVKASTAEVDRIGDLLAALRTGKKDTMIQARHRLLDMFRNSLTDAWADRAAAIGQADRSLVQRSLTSLTDIAMHRPVRRDQNGVVISKGHHLSFTVSLAYLNRMWVIDWFLGKPIGINMVRSRVIQSGTEATERFNHVIRDIDFNTLFTPGRVSNPVKPSSTDRKSVV